MNLKIKCEECGSTFWARGWVEDNTNAAGINDDDPREGACEHVRNGGEYSIVDQEYDEEEP